MRLSEDKINELKTRIESGEEITVEGLINSGFVNSERGANRYLEACGQPKGEVSQVIEKEVKPKSQTFKIKDDYGKLKTIKPINSIDSGIVIFTT